MAQSALDIVIDYKTVLKDEKLFSLLSRVSASCSCHMDMILLPVISVCSGLMSRARVVTHKDHIDFEEPNVIWSCVAAAPGKSN